MFLRFEKRNVQHRKTAWLITWSLSAVNVDGSSEGEEVITVSILINGQPIYTRSAVNVTKDVSSGDLHIYEVDDGTILTHNHKHGAVVLAKLMLDTIKETK